MKAPPPNKPPPESKTTNLVEKLDSPLICRAFFIGVSYLARAIGCESALARGDIEDPQKRVLNPFHLQRAVRGLFERFAQFRRAQERTAGAAQEVQSVLNN